MLRVMIKNNFKLMFRNPWIMVWMILGPVMATGILSAAFHNVLKTYEKKESFTVGYNISPDSPFNEALNHLSHQEEENSIHWIPCDKEEIKGKIQSREIQVGVSIDGMNTEILSTQDNSTQANTIEYIMFSLSHQGGEPKSIKKIDNVLIPVPSASDYYGKVMLTMFMMCDIVVLSFVISSERKNRIQERLKISCAGKVSLYLGKLIPAFLITVVTSGIALLICTVVYQISWGCYLKSTGLLLLGAATVSAYGILIFYSIQNIGAAVISGFVFIWVAGFFGGCYETYMYSSAPESLKTLSPVYHLNRALVEYQTIGHSEYGITCVIFMSCLFLVFALIGCLLMNRRMEVA